MEHRNTYKPKKKKTNEVVVRTQQQRPHHNNHKNHAQKRNKPISIENLFNGNVVANLRFDNPNHDLSGYVYREVYIKDAYGNIQSAKEKQFFNSSKEHREIHVGEDYKK